MVKHKRKVAVFDGAAVSATSDTWESYLEMEWMLQQLQYLDLLLIYNDRPACVVQL